MKKVLISDSVDEKCTELLKKAGFDVTYKTDFSSEELQSVIADYNALIVRSSTSVDAALIDKMEKMEMNLLLRMRLKNQTTSFPSSGVIP